MDTNDDSVFEEEDFPDSLLDELNNFYAQSVNKDGDQPPVDDALTRYFDQYEKLPRTEADSREHTRESVHSAAASSSYFPDDRSVHDATLSQANRTQSDQSRLAGELQQGSQPVLAQYDREQLGSSFSRNERLPRAFYTGSTGSRNSPSGQENTPGALPRLRVAPSFRNNLSPLNASYSLRREPMLSGFRAGDQHRSAEPTPGRRQKIPPVYGPDLVSHPNVPLPFGRGSDNALQSAPRGSRGQEDTPAQARPVTEMEASQPGSGQRAGLAQRSSPTMTEAPLLSSSRGLNTTGIHEARLQHSSTAIRDAEVPATEAPNRGLSGWLVVISALCAAVVLALLVRQWNLQAHEATVALERKVAALQMQVEDYARREREHRLFVSQQAPPLPSEASIHDQEPRNLALISEGAHILKGYTTPPAASAWWKWSQSFRADPDCMLRAPTAECWPIHDEAVIAIGLGQRANLSGIRFHFAAVNEPYNFDAYSIVGSSDFDHLKHTVSDQGFDLSDATNVTQIAMRLSGFGDLCIRSVEVVGIVL